MIQHAIDSAVAKRLAGVVDEFALADPEPQPDSIWVGSMKRRRGFDPSDYNGLATLTLVRDDGILRWVYQPPARGPVTRRARRASVRRIGADPVYEFSFQETPPNQVIAAIENLDGKLTPNQGLRILKEGKFVAADDKPIKGKVLLLVHGTFSKSEMFIDELLAVKSGSGRDLLQRATSGPNKYDEVLAFEHPTLSVSPWINALDLEDELASVEGPIDVVCHSRGGLVVAWWLRNAKRQVNTVVFVGAPLEGTSLAAPASLRGALQALANVLQGLEYASALASTIVPFTAAVTGLSKILGGILRLGASTPLADAAVVAVPGLAGQSRVGNNAELLRLNRLPWISTPTFHAVLSNFQPGDTDAAWWEIWKHLSNPKEKLLDWGADTIFNGEKNDLVVDTKSMSLLRGTQLKKAQLLDFGDSDRVHHCNYFQQDETVKRLRQALNL